MKHITALLIFILGALSAEAYNPDESSGMIFFREKSYELALPKLQRAAKAGSLPALDALGQMYQHGWGVKADKTIMMNMYSKAAMQNYHPTLYNLGRYYIESGDKEKGLEMLAKASEYGSVIASMFLGYDYTATDPAKAIKYFRHAEANGEESALNGIAMVYITGKDYENAFATLLEARKKRVLTDETKFMLASMYYTGQGTVKDLDKALELVTEAKENGYAPAVQAYDEVYTAANKVTLPLYPGGTAALYRFIRKNARTPHAAIQSALNGTATVEFTITPQGTVTGAHYVRRCNVRVDEEVMRIINMLSGWTPATKGGKKRSTVARLSMSFFPAYSSELKFVSIR